MHSPWINNVVKVHVSISGILFVGKFNNLSIHVYELVDCTVASCKEFYDEKKSKKIRWNWVDLFGDVCGIAKNM